MFAHSIGAGDKLIILLSEGSTEKQVNDLFMTLKKVKNNAICYLDPNEPEAAPRLAEVCRNANVYFTTQWNKPTETWPWEYDPFWVIHATPDSVHSGYVIAKRLFEHMNGEGNIVAIQGRMGNSSAMGRFEGLQKALKEYPKITLLDAQPADWNRLKAWSLTERWLRKHKNIKGIWTATDEMAMGAIEALRDANKSGTIMVTGVDATGDAVNAIIKGEMLCTVSPDPYWQSGMSLSFAYHAYQDKIKPSELAKSKRAFYTSTLLVSRDNAESFLRDYVNGEPELDYQALWKQKWNGPLRGIE
jgi:ABC-type sugar transport system substrate-binding protein